jgi:hypothetical protein
MSNFRGAGMCARKKQPTYDNAAALSDTDRLELARYEFTALLDRLATSELSAASYRLILSTIARLLRQGRTSEAVTTQWVGDQLDLSRNTIGDAYSDLSEAGLVKRIVNTARGAPTRTSLTGPALGVVRLLRDVRSITLPAAQAAPRAASASSEPRVPVQSQLPHAALSSRTDDPAASDQHVIEHVDSTGPMVSSAPVQNDQLMVEPSDLALPSDPIWVTVQSTAVRYSPEVHASALAKVPPEVRYETMQGNLKPADLDAAWDLTDDEKACLLSYCDKREPRPVPTAQQKRAPVVAVPTSAHPELAKALYERRPLLASKVGDERASQVMDEIAYMITLKNLGQGDLLGGARAGTSLVMAGRWSTPRGMTVDWLGAVARGLEEASPAWPGDAQKNVR